MMEIVAIIFVAISSFLLVVDIVAPSIVFDIQFVLYLIILVLNYIRVKTFNLYQIWIVGYIFIIWSEMRITSTESIGTNYLIPYLRYTLANCLVLLGYHFYRNKKTFIQNKVRYISKTNWMFSAIIIILYVLYISLSLRSAITNLQFGRQLSSAKGSSSLTGSLISALGTLLPAIIAHYVKYIKGRKTIISFIFSLPIFAIVLLQATRFKFLFSVLPYLIVVDVFSLGTIERKKNVILFISLLLLFGISSFIKSNRNAAFAEIENPSLFKQQANETDPFIMKLAKEMSPEGVIKMASIADEYFSKHTLHWGKEMSFILYFWVPRAIWPNKPTQLDYWLIREYSSEEIADSYSSASGFIGEARADFGWGCLLFALMLGMLFKRIDFTKEIIWLHYRGSFNTIFIAILVPWTFFFVRSPITSTMSLFWEFVIYYMFVRLFAAPTASYS